VRPGTVLNSGETIARLADLPEVHQVNDLRVAVDRIQDDLRSFKEKHQLDQVVTINVASTEPPFELLDVHQSLEKLLEPQDCHHHNVLPSSSLYAWAALDMGWPYLN